MKLRSLISLLFVVVGVSCINTAALAFAPSAETRCFRSTGSLQARSTENAEEGQRTGLNRRNFLVWSSSLVVASPLLVAPKPSHASLLDEFGTDPSKIEVKKVVASSTTATATPVPTTGRTEIDPSLRASYYYPTAKKRYLPRIQKVTTDIGGCSDALVTGDWESAQSFAKTAENAILPLQLYVSSLDGQGLSMSTGFAKTMRVEALEYERAYKRFDKALQKRDSLTALQAVSDMGVAVANYRQAGRLKDDDGNIPSIDEMKRMTMRRPTVAVAQAN